MAIKPYESTGLAIFTSYWKQWLCIESWFMHDSMNNPQVFTVIWLEQISAGDGQSRPEIIPGEPPRSARSEHHQQHGTDPEPARQDRKQRPEAETGARDEPRGGGTRSRTWGG